MGENLYDLVCLILGRWVLSLLLLYLMFHSVCGVLATCCHGRVNTLNRTYLRSS